MSAITTHVLDVSTGRPATGVDVRLESARSDGEWTLVGRGATDGDGRLRTLMRPDEPLTAGVYRLTFGTQHYFRLAGVPSFYPHISVVFEVTDGESHYHVPLLVSPFGYSTYRGS